MNPTPGARPGVPWWVLPAMLMSGVVGGMTVHWLDGPAHGPEATTSLAPAVLPNEPAGPSAHLGQAHIQPASTARLPTEVPTELPTELPIVLSGVLVVDGRPSMALVRVGLSAPGLVRVGDRLSATATVAAIESNALVVRDGALETRIAVSAPAAAAANAVPLQKPPSLATGTEGPALPPLAVDGSGLSSGTAAFRALLDERARSAKR